METIDLRLRSRLSPFAPAADRMQRFSSPGRKIEIRPEGLSFDLCVLFIDRLLTLYSTWMIISEPFDESDARVWLLQEIREPNLSLFMDFDEQMHPDISLLGAAGLPERVLGQNYNYREDYSSATIDALALKGSGPVYDFCSKTLRSNIWSSGWGADMRNIGSLVFAAGVLVKSPLWFTLEPSVDFKPGWHYATGKPHFVHENNLTAGFKEACPKRSAYCYFMNTTSCPWDTSVGLSNEQTKQLDLPFSKENTKFVSFDTRVFSNLRKLPLFHTVKCMPSISALSQLF